MRKIKVKVVVKYTDKKRKKECSTFADVSVGNGLTFPESIDVTEVSLIDVSDEEFNPTKTEENKP